MHLFPLLKPLLERLGEDFFRRAPREPGVYIMSGADGRILYVGQSRNLHDRLASYKNARHDIAPRKVVRLVHQVTSIAWEICGNPVQAQLRENELIRLYRPRFNRMNTFPGAYPFICLSAESCAFQIRLTRRPTSGEEVYGAFKGGATIAYAALLRLTWWRLHQVTRTGRLPAGLLSGRPPSLYAFEVLPQSPNLEDHIGALRRYLGGDSDELSNLSAQAEGGDGAQPTLFEQRLGESDRAILKRFYERATRPLAVFKRQSDAPWMPQPDVDDWMIITSDVRSPTGEGNEEIGIEPASILNG
jgi:predicted GIY-YIG superfamily endonuclease